MHELAIWMLFAFIFLSVFWIYQFIPLMLLSDSDFPGKYDKALWVAAFVMMFPCAPFAFLGWKSAYASMRAEERKVSGGEQ